MSAPIFIFSAGWRSGSTLLQRLISASNEVLIWGEAGGALDYFTESFSCYEQMLGDGNQRFKHGFGGNGAVEFAKFKSELDQKNHFWSACMNPPIEQVTDNFRGFLEKMYGQPAIKLGYPSWGVKEVRSGIDTALFLKRIFPDAKFLFLVRNPFDVITSIKKRNWMDHIDHPLPIIFYAQHWKKLANEFKQTDFGLLIKYEDLICDQFEIQKLRDYLNLTDIPDNFIKESHADWKVNNKSELSFFEKKTLTYILKKELILYNYK